MIKPNSTLLLAYVGKVSQSFYSFYSANEHKAYKAFNILYKLIKTSEAKS